MLNRRSGLEQLKTLLVILNSYLPVSLLWHNIIEPHRLLGFSLLFRSLFRNTRFWTGLGYHVQRWWPCIIIHARLGEAATHSAIVFQNSFLGGAETLNKTNTIMYVSPRTPGQRKSVRNRDFYHIWPPRPPTNPSIHGYFLLKSTDHSVQKNKCSNNHVIIFACDRPAVHVARMHSASVSNSARSVAHPFRCACACHMCSVFVCMFIYAWY